MRTWTATARILRVNHGGEHGAISIYGTQIALAHWRCPKLLPFLRRTLDHEREHRISFARMMPSRGSKPCRLMWIWGVGGTVLGVVTGLLGERAVLICTESVERTVHRHLEDQISYLQHRDLELANLVRDIQQQEREHLTFATNGIDKRTPLDGLLDRLITVATEALIWLSTRGDSRRLALELAQPERPA